MSTFQEVIDRARPTLNDADKVRYPDAECFAYLVDGLREACLVRPDLFSITGVVTCVAGVEQTLPATGWFVIDVLNVVGGDEVLEADFATLRAFNPSWRTASAGPAKNWLPFPSNPQSGPNQKFYVSPPSPNGQQLNVVYADFDGDAYAIGDALPTPEQYDTAFEAYVIFRAETKDDEHVNTNRAAQFRQAFEQMLGVGKAVEATT